MVPLDICQCQLARQSQTSRRNQCPLDFIRPTTDHFVDGIAQGVLEGSIEHRLGCSRSECSCRP